MLDALAARWTEHMRRGDFAAAWQVSDRVLRLRPAESTRSRPRHEQAVWSGQPLDGRRVLVRCYHGLGDTIQFARFLPRLRATARSVVLWAQPELIPLLAPGGLADEVLPLGEGDPPVAHDADVEIMELGHVFRIRPEELPGTVPYLYAPRALLPADGGVRVGLVARSGAWDARRNPPPHLLAHLLDLPGTRWWLLQPDPEPGLAAAEHLPLDVAGTAAVMRGLDLVVTVDSMPAHLAGALGVPVWTLLHADADWRWMRGRTDSPWYPTMRLFRQPRPGAWDAVIDAVQSALRRQAWSGLAMRRAAAS